MISFFNKSSGGGGGGDGTTQNIFCQLEEPETKKGIWLQAEKEIEHITTDEEIYIAGTWTDIGSKGSTPDNYTRKYALVSRTIYAFNGSSTIANYKYNLDTKTWTTFASFPESMGEVRLAVIGTDIYALSRYI